MSISPLSIVALVAAVLVSPYFLIAAGVFEVVGFAGRWAAGVGNSQDQL